MECMGKRVLTQVAAQVCLWLAALIVLYVAFFSHKARAQETATYQRVMAAQETWQGAVVVPSAWDGGKPAKPASEPPAARQTPIQRVVEGAQYCFIAWHGRQRAKKPETWKIECHGG
jgi:hypothetical protein